MDGVDPETLLEWLQTGTGDERDLQLMALEQLCMLLLMSDNIDRCFESCPPRSFLPALGKIFLDETAPESILEVTARAITYYLDVSNECTRRITQVDGAVKAICHRLIVAEMSDRTSKDLAEQCVKLLEHICQREASAVYEAGGLQCMLHLICQHDQHIHKDTMHSAMTVITRLCSKVNPQDTNLVKCSSDLGVLLLHDDSKISECALRCFAALTDRFIRKSLDPAKLATSSNLINNLLTTLVPTFISDEFEKIENLEQKNKIAPLNRSPAFISVVLSLISNLCRGSSIVTDQVTKSPKLIPAIKSVLQSKDERCAMDSLRFADLLVVLLCEGRLVYPKSSTETALNPIIERTHRHLISAIRKRDTNALIDAIENETVDSNFVDEVGQTLLNWCSAFGTSDMVIYLCNKGADPNKGQRSSSLHYAACFGRSDIVKILLQHGANPDLHDEEGRTALEKAYERNDENHQKVVKILENPGNFITVNSNSNRASNLNGENNSLDENIFKKSDDDKQPVMQGVDLVLGKKILKKLIPIFCDIFQNSLVISIRRSTLSLIRKCILHLSKDGLSEFINFTGQKQQDKEKCDFVENLMGVLVTVFNIEDEIEGKEYALLIMKYLLQTDSSFWLEQLIRLGIYEKVEILSNNAFKKPENRTNKTVQQSASTSVVENLTSAFQTLINMSEAPKSTFNDDKFENRSIDLTPPFAPTTFKLDTDSTNESNYRKDNITDNFEMINILPEREAAKISLPTVEVAKWNKIQTTPSKDSNFTNTKSDVVEAASAVAYAIGIQIGENPKPKNNSSIISGNGKTSDDWNLGDEVFYKWDDWRLIRNKNSLFMWCDVIAFEFSDHSNGWIRFLIDGKLNILKSNGELEESVDDIDSRANFTAKFQKAKVAAKVNIRPLNIFSAPDVFQRILSGNWKIFCFKAGQLIFTNSESDYREILIKSDMPIFSVENSKGKSISFNAESTLGLDFVTGWAARGGSHRLHFQAEIQRLQLHKTAKELWNKYLKEAKAKPREDLICLKNDALLIVQLSTKINELEKSQNFSSIQGYVDSLFNVLCRIRGSLSNEHLLSTFEISISNIISSLLFLVNLALKDGSKIISKCFLQVFSNPCDLNSLIRRVVLVLESVEKFSQQLYDAPGGSPFGLQLLTRRFLLRLEQGYVEKSEENNIFLNRTDRKFKSEPLSTVGSLRQYLYRMVLKHWYDYPRDTFHFIKCIKKMNERNDSLEFTYTSDFDTNGIIYYLGTNGQKADEWANPAVIKIVNVCCSDGANDPYNQSSNILSRDSNSLSCHTYDFPNSHFTLDLGVWVIPTAYTLRHSQHYIKSALRNWLFQGSCNGYEWDILLKHKDDQFLNESGSTATWFLENDNKCLKSYRYFRIAQNGKNASGSSYVLSLSGFELYGLIVDAVETDLKPLILTQSPITKKSLKTMNTPLTSLIAGNKKQKQKNNTPKDSSPDVISKNVTPNLHYARSPTAASLRHPRKQKAQKLTNEKHNSGFEFNEGDKLNLNDLKLSGNVKLKALRTQRNRLANVNNSVQLDSNNSVDENFDLTNNLPPIAPNVTCGSFLKIGTRVVPGQDWLWGNYHKSIIGTVISVGKSGNGWVDVQWDNGTVNSYRYGHNEKFDIEPANDSNSKSHRSKTKSKSSIENCKLKSGKLAKDLKRFTNLNSIEDEDSQKISQNNLNVEVTNSGMTSSTISQKSMSTTNLFDDRQKRNYYSVASTNQAASAESLQHPTLSLENLLARSRFYTDRILEIYDEQQSPTSDLRSFNNIQNSNINDSSEENSISANTFVGGSQPHLSTLSFTENNYNSDQIFLSSNTVISEEIKMENDALINKNNNIDNVDGNDKSKSEPDLVSTTQPQLKRRFKSLVPTLTNYDKEKNCSSNCNKKIKETKPILNEELIKTGKNIDSDQKSLIDTELLSPLERIIDVDYIDKFLNSTEFRERLVNAYSEITYDDQLSTPISSNYNLVNNNVPNDETANTFFENAILDDFLSDQSLSQNNSMLDFFKTDQSNISPSTSNESSTKLSNDLETHSDRHQLSNIGLSLRLKLGNYAEVLKGMMQQVIDSSDIMNSNFDQDELANELFNDEMISSQSIIHENCDSDFPSQNFTVEVESLASAAATLRQHFSSSGVKSSSESVKNRSSNIGLNFSLDRLSVLDSDSVDATSSRNNDSKVDWRQMFLGGESDISGSIPFFNNLNGGIHALSKNERTNINSYKDKRLLRIWDDDYVLRRQFGALIPAFDPRPGRTNVNQTQEVELNDENNVKYTRKGSIVKQLYTLKPLTDNESQMIRLYLMGPNMPNIENQAIELTDDNATLFYYIQELCNLTEWNKNFETNRHIWEPTYTILYKTTYYENKSLDAMLKRSNAKHFNKDELKGLVKETMDLIKLLSEARSKFDILISDESFHSSKLTQKLSQCLTDPIIVSAMALPNWCNELIYKYPCLFSRETRIMHLHVTAFGTSRSIAFLQNRRDQILEQNRLTGVMSTGSNMAGIRREDHYPEYRIGRLKHERIKVYRSDQFLLENAIKVLNFHAMRKSVLEIEYYNEEGTGLGPTLEFFSLLSAEFQRKSLGMWFCDDFDEQEIELESNTVDLGEGEKPPGYYIRRSGGLFPAYLPQNSLDRIRILELFKIFGIFLAKVIQDNRLVDIPLSPIFLKLVFLPKVPSVEKLNLNDILTIKDLESIYPIKAAFLKSLSSLVEQKKEILNSKHLNNMERSEAISLLKLELNNGNKCALEDLALTFVINPPSKIFTYKEIELIKNGSNIDVTINNVEDYLEKCLNFYLNFGIREQIDSFCEGFDLVFPLKSLNSFTLKEIQLLLFGEQSPQWSREDVLKYTEPKLGYSRDSPGFQRFVDVLVNMNAQERKAFLQFTTGCSSLPPGGLANLHPRLTIVRKVDAGDGSYPSVNTCVHYLKLPEYSSIDILKKRLLAATFEKGFHLN